MPSKAKKHSKTPSSVSKFDHLASPQTPQSMVPIQGVEPDKEDVRYSLEEASGKYPSLIGKSAFIGRVVQVDQDSKGCKIWLSEPSMVASSLTPGSIVSVSFPSMISKFPSRFPLTPFADECVRQNYIHLDEKLANEAGNYFALATVFPTSKVAKNEVRLSSNLSITMGCPKPGTVMFVYPVKSQFITGHGKRDENPHMTKGVSLSVYDCRELFLKLVQSNFKLTRNNSSVDISSEQSYDYSQNGTVASPRTPLNQSRPSSSTNKFLTSPLCEDSVLNLANSNGSAIDPFDIKEMLIDESAKRLLQTCTTIWLYSRWLMTGNIVSIPILSQLCTFRVINAKEGLEDDANHNLTNESCSDLPDDHYETLDCAIDAFVVKRDTKIYLCLPSKLALETPKRCDLPRNGFELMDTRPDSGGAITKLGGLCEEYAVLKDIILSSLVDTFSRFGLRATKGVLLHGPPGTGKTSLARLCASDTGVNFFTVNGPEIVSPYHGESEKALHEVFDAACRATPSVIFIDELDAIAPERKDGGEALSQGVVCTLLNLMDGIGRMEGLLIIAVTNRPDTIEPALRRSGRLDREIELGVPSPKQRLDILLSYLNEMKHSLMDKQVEHLASVTHGFVGADLAQLCNEAALVCFRRGAYSINPYNYPHRTSTICEEYPDHIIETKCLNNFRDIMKDYSDSASLSISCLDTSQRPPTLHSNGSISDAPHDSQNDIEGQILNVTFEDFENARMRVRPSAMREVRLEVPKVRWDDIGGQKEVKRQLIEAVEWPQKHQNAFNRIGIRPPTGVLMFGPPGCSKTLLARAIASEAGMNFLAIKGPELFSKWVGESEKAVRSLFAKARTNAPSIIFFDEIDGLAATRGKESDGVSVSDRVMSQLLVEMDGLHQRVGVTVIAATNRPDKIDQALLRPGRFDRLIYVGLPDKADREEIFGVHLLKIPCSSDVSIKELACLTEGFSGADISFICREAAAVATEESFNNTLEIRMQHLKSVIAQVQPSTSHSYEELSAKFQRLVHSNGKVDKLGHQECSSSSSWFPMWTYAKSKASYFLRLPGG